MKKFLTDIRTVAALLMASATFVACSSDDNIIEEQPVQPTGQVYTLTVNASKGGDATTRALALDGEDGKTLNATWATYEDVYVKKGDDGWATSGSLKPQSDGTHTYYVTPDFATDELYVALPDISSQTVTLTANVGSRIYTYERADVTFVNGKYYAITVKMTDSTQQLPLTVEALTAGTVTVDIASTSFAGMYYSKNGDTKALIEKSTDIDVNAGDKVQFYGKGTSTQIFSLNTNVSIRGTAQTKVYGNIMSLINETGYTTEKNLPSDSNFGHLFEENTGLTDASGLLLPAETLATDCYRGMFENCIYLTTAPELAAKTLVTNCYYAMFSGCGYLNYVKCLATSGINENESTTDWLKGVYTLGGGVRNRPKRQIIMAHEECERHPHKLDSV